jgi:hypothetical protein
MELIMKFETLGDIKNQLDPLIDNIRNENNNYCKCIITLYDEIIKSAKLWFDSYVKIHNLTGDQFIKYNKHNCNLKLTLKDIDQLNTIYTYLKK